MKKLIIIYIILCFNIIFPQSQWVDENPYRINGPKVQFINDNTGWVLPLYGPNSLFKTSDGGQNWFLVHNFVNNWNQLLLERFTFTDLDTGYICIRPGSSENKIMKTTNGGIDWEDNLIFPYEGDIENLYFLNGSTGWVVYRKSSDSLQHIIFKTTNGGSNWEVNDTFPAIWSDQTHIFFIHKNVGWFSISNNSSSLFRTNDGGENWFNIYSVSKNIVALKFYDLIHGYALMNGSLYKTSDHGISWSQLNNLSFNHLGLLELNKIDSGITIVAAGYPGYPTYLSTVAISTDDGNSWLQYSKNGGLEYWPRSISIANQDHIYIGYYTNVKEVINLNFDWDLNLPVGPTQNLESIVSVPGGKIFAIGWKYNSLTNTTNSAIINTPPAWRVKSIYPNQKLKSAWVKNNSEVFIGGIDYSNGNRSIIYKTDNEADSLIIKYNENGDIINSICFSNTTNGFAVGNNGTVVTTTDGGNSWFRAANFTDENLHFILFYNSQIGLICGANGTLFKTTNGGTNWNQKNTGTSDNLNSLFFQNQNDIIIVGDNGIIMKSEDIGETWTTIYSSPNYVFNSIIGLDSMHIGVYGGNKIDSSAYFMESFNGGLSWVPYTFPYLKTLNFALKEFSNAWAVGNYGSIINSAGTWFSPVEFTIFSAKYNSNNSVLLSWQTSTETNNHGFEIQRSTNKIDWNTIGFKEGNGTTTEKHNYTYSDNVSSLNSDKLFYRLKQVDFDGSYKYSDVVEVSISMPKKFSLNQNYPNPFNPVTVIGYQLPVGAQVTLKVYDVLGREAATLVNEYKPAGKYEVKFDASKFPSGIYFYRIAIHSDKLEANGYTVCKKMILLK